VPRDAPAASGIVAKRTAADQINAGQRPARVVAAWGISNKTAMATPSPGGKARPL